MEPAKRGLRGGWLFPAVFTGFTVLFLANPAPAELRAGTAEVKSLTGTVEVQRQGQTQWVPAMVGMRLVERDEVRAHAAASAVLDLPDGSTLFVAENSRVVVAKLEVDPQNNARQALFHLVVGKVRAVVTQAALTLVRARQSNFAISTPTAVAAVRGTLYEVSYNSTLNTMTVAVLPRQPGTARGLVTCTSLFQRFFSVPVGEGFASFAKGTDACSAPLAFESLSPAERDTIGTLSNPVPPGPTFSGPVNVPAFIDVVNLISGPAPVLFTSVPSDGQNPTGGPSSIGLDISQQQPATTQ